MSKIRRRMLMSFGGGGEPPQRTYIKKGLIFYLDGIDKGTDSSCWTDLIGGKKFVYNNCGINKNSVSFNGVDSFARCIDNIAPSDKNNATFEIAFKLEGQEDSVLFCPTGKGKIDEFGFYIKPKNKHLGTGFGPQSAGFRFIIPEDINVNNNMSISGYNAKQRKNWYINLRPNALGLSGYESYNIKGNDGTFLGRRNYPNSPMFFKGVIYSIRIYDRILSYEEILNNQETDKQRFFGEVIS